MPQQRRKNVFIFASMSHMSITLPHRPAQSNYDSKSPHRTCLSNGGRMLSSLPAGQPWTNWAPTLVCQLRVTMTVSLLTEHASATAEECFHLCQHATHVNRATHVGQLRVTMTVRFLTENASATAEECFHLSQQANHGQTGHPHWFASSE